MVLLKLIPMKQYFSTKELSILSGLDENIITKLGNKKTKVLSKVARGQFDWDALIIARSIYHLRKTWGSYLKLTGKFKGFIKSNHLNNDSAIIIYQDKICHSQLLEVFINNEKKSLKELLLSYNTCEYIEIISSDNVGASTDVRKTNQTTEDFLLELKEKYGDYSNLGMCVFVAKVVDELWQLGYKEKIPNFAKKADFAPISCDTDIILDDDLMLVG